ncbi:CLUMA_CG012476, isoform A [Clunio marinus]|uniref:CLUMA_CG012476, isoform A n=1 Tax=Clunio marinus TaxID=568069 RepID=A0A1J1IG13_9DIPT|nr:CLUMA_CG012476, isoform A [Clunio marinus]
MNLLPKTSEEFATKEYWNKFFQKRGKSAFDWYGEYPELCGVLSKYIKTIDQILMVGCGNSKLSVDMFDVGYKSITNIDISEVVIEQMKKTYRDRGDCKWITMDATSMSFDNDSYSVVLDKGTLDAMMSEESESINEMVEKYFSEVTRVLKTMGRYVCVSLLQEHIIKSLLDFFPKNNFLFRVVRCLEAESKTSTTNEDGSSMPVFLIVATKLMKLPNVILEISHDGEAIERLQDANVLTNSILTTQRASMIRNGLIRKSNFDDEINFDLYRPNENIPRFSLFILDQKMSAKGGDYAAFICPQGRECEWLFASKQGRRKLLESAQHSRLAIVTMHRDQTYTSLDDVKLELNETVKSFAPRNLKDSSKIPFLSLGSDVGTRKIICRGRSGLSGEFVVEDVTLDTGKTFRRLIFLSNQNVIQSEAMLRNVKKKNVIDFSFLSCQHHAYMILGMQTVPSKHKHLVIGLGGGGLINFIYHHLKDFNTTVVEIDPEIVNIAKEHFGVVEDKSRMEIVVDDGLDYLKKMSEDKKLFQSILFDVDSKDQSFGISCPPKEFLEIEILEIVKILLPSNGIFILNLLCRDQDSREQAIVKLKKMFSSVYSYKLEEDVNEIFYCFKENPPKIEETFKQSGKKLNTIKKETIDISNLMKNFKLI